MNMKIYVAVITDWPDTSIIRDIIDVFDNAADAQFAIDNTPVESNRVAEIREFELWNSAYNSGWDDGYDSGYDDGAGEYY